MPYSIIDSIEEDRLDDLVSLYRQAWWSTQRTREEVRRMLAGSNLVVGLVDTEPDRLVGFTRVLTDFVYRAYVHDVIVDESLRGQGLSRRLGEAVVNHPKLKTVEKLILTCQPELIPVYERWGFETGWEGMVLMIRPGLDCGPSTA